jgi:predicted GNAT family acetyltransferase
MMGCVMEIVDNDGRYELRLDGVTRGFAQYRDSGGRRVFLHTEIEAGFEGRGLASELVRFALDDVRDRGKRIVARCPMVAAYVGKHHEWDDLIDVTGGVDAH